MKKHNFEKDIDVPSKQKIMYDYNAKDCEQCNPDSVCCYCKNITCYKLEEDLKRKEQECERLKNIINEAKNSKLDLKSFLVGEAVQNKYEQQLEAYKMEAEEGKEINAELKVENDLLRQYNDSKQASYESMQQQWNEVELENRRLKKENETLKADLKSLEYTVVLQGKRDIDNAADLFAKHIAKIESENSILKAENTELKAENDELKYKAEFFENYNNAHIDKIMKLEKTLTEIKEIIHFNKTNRLSGGADISIEQILQKISEVKNDNA